MGICGSNSCFFKKDGLKQQYKSMDSIIMRQQSCLSRLSLTSEYYLTSNDEEELRRKLYSLFDKFDKNKDGKLDYHETYQFIKHNMRYQDSFDLNQLTQDMLEGAQLNDDGTICKQQFYQIFKKV